MELSIFQKFLAEFFIVIYMFSVGLIAPKGAVVHSLRKEGITCKALILNFLMIPFIGIVLIQLFTLPIDIKTGLILLIISPGGLFTLNFIRVSHANSNLAVALLCLLTIISIVITPLIASLYIRVGELSLVFYTILHLFLFIAAPLYIGQYLARFIPQKESLSAILGILSIITFISFNLLTSNIKSDALHTIGWNGIFIIVLLVLSSWVLGWLMGGKQQENKKVLAISTSMRNVGFCYPFALNELAHTNAIVSIIAFSTLSILMNMGFALVLNYREKHGRTH